MFPQIATNLTVKPFYPTCEIKNEMALSVKCPLSKTEVFFQVGNHNKLMANIF